MTNMRQPKNSRRGSILLIEVLIVLAILAVSLGVLVPNLIKNQQVQNENAAATRLTQIWNSEFAAEQLYGVAMPLAQLALADLTKPISCLNTFLLSGQQAQAPKGYSLAFSPASSLSSPIAGCGTVTGYSGFAISLDPTDSLEAERHFYLSSVDGGLVHFTDQNRPATITDSVLPVSVSTTGQISTILSVQNSGTTNPTNPTNPVTPPPPPPPPPPGISGGSVMSTSFSPGAIYTTPAFGVASVPVICSCVLIDSPSAYPSSSIGTAKVATQFTVTFNQNPGFIRVGLVDLDTVQNPIVPPNAFTPPPYNELVCDTFASSPQPGCTANATGFNIGANDRLQVYIINNLGSDAAAYVVSWTISYQ